MLRTLTTRGRGVVTGALTAVLVALAPAAHATAPATPGSGATSTYVVQVAAGTIDTTAAVLGDLGATPNVTFDHVMDGFSVDLTGAQARTLAAMPQVSAVIKEHAFSVAGTQNPAIWGLDRLDQRTLPLDDRYTYPSSGGAGVRVYIVDTGVSPNPALGGRLVSGYTDVADANGTTDCNGHGTHVAGTVASDLYGVAKSATIVPVRVLDCSGSGTTTTVIAGLDWIVAQHVPGTPGVVNLSLSGAVDTSLNSAIASVVADGLTVVVAAGNSDGDACNASPGSAPTALTVGASDSTDARAYFSNWGPCLDLFAPGVAIQSLSASDPAGSAVMSGTSMASPHAAGVAALYLAQFPIATPAQVATALVSGGESVVTDAGTGSTTDLLSSNVIPAPDAVGGLTVSAITSTTATLTWIAPAGTAPLTYQATYQTGGGAWTLAPPVASTTTTLTGLTPSTAYQVEITATDEFGTSTPAGPVTATTIETTDPGLTPTEKYVTSVYGELFNRDPDAGGLVGWTRALDGGAPRRAVADAITSSTEYRGILISAAYQTYLGRGPDAGGKAFWLANMNAGMTIQQMEAGFVASPEYYQKAGGTSDGWAATLYSQVLGRTPAPSEVAYWTGQVAGGASHTAVALGFLLSTEHLTAVIDGYYQHLLGRGIDPSGKASWVGAIQRGSRVEEVIGGIIASPEYYAKNT